MERLKFDLLYRWFVGLGIDDAVWDHSVFSKNRDRLLEGDIAAKFMAAVLTQPNVKQLLFTTNQPTPRRRLLLQQPARTSCCCSLQFPEWAECDPSARRSCRLRA